MPSSSARSFWQRALLSLGFVLSVALLAVFSESCGKDC